MSRLSAVDVAEIRASFAAGHDVKVIAAKYNLKLQYCREIISGKYWRHVPGIPSSVAILPKRLHLGCDPMCGECVAVQEAFNDKMEVYVEKARRSFWKEMRRLLPGMFAAEYPKWLDLEVKEFNVRTLEIAADWAFEVWNQGVPIAGKPEGGAR